MMVLVVILCLAIAALGLFAMRLRERFPKRSRRKDKKPRYFAVDLAKDDAEQQQEG